MLPKPYSNCDLDNLESNKETEYELVNLVAKSKYLYTQQSCLFLCMQKQLIENCNCTYPYFFSLFVGAEQCFTGDQLECAYTVMGYFAIDGYIQENCFPLCPLECNRTEFSYTITDVELIGEHIVDFIRENPNLASDFVTKPINAFTVKDSISQLSIFYSSLTYTLTTEERKKLIRFVCLFVCM